MADIGGQLAVEHIAKRYGSTQALRDVSLKIREGEVHALLGENGAGKSTLLSVIGGLVAADSGQILCDGSQVSITSSEDAHLHGIGLVHQHFTLVPELTAAEHLLLSGPPTRRIGRSEVKDAERHLSRLGEEFGLPVRPGVPVGTMSVGEMQRVEILRVLARRPRFILLDEPTATLAPTSVEPFLERVTEMARAGHGVVFITHHLEEAMACADLITVLRGGSVVMDAVPPAQTSAAQLADEMVGGADINPSLRRTDEATTDRILELSAISVRSSRAGPDLHDIDLVVRSSEIVAIAGVDGNGQTELEDLLTGLARSTDGEFRLHGRQVAELSPAALDRAGVRVVSSDRHRRAVIPTLSISENFTLGMAVRRPFARWWRTDREAIGDAAEAMREEYEIKAPDLDAPLATLSGGNQQRVVLARALRAGARLLVACQPTRGLDIRAAAYVRRRLAEAAADGSGVLLISSDLDEVMELADRCVVMSGGTTAASLEGRRFTRANVGRAMGGAPEERVA